MTAETALPRDGLDAPLTFSFVARRDASVDLLVKADTGTFYANGIAQAVTSASAKLDYDIKGQKVEISDALIDLGATKIPFNGAIIDVERVKPELSKGYAFEIVANDAVAQAAASGEAPEPFNAAVTGYFLSGAKTLHLDQIGLSMESGSFAGTLDMRFGDKSPAINFSARADRLSTKSVKQLWPYWFGAKSRDWVLTHIQDGTVTNAAIDVSLAAGRIPEHPEPLIFKDKELQISFRRERPGAQLSGRPACRERHHRAVRSNG